VELPVLMSAAVVVVVVKEACDMVVVVVKAVCEVVVVVCWSESILGHGPFQCCWCFFSHANIMFVVFTAHVHYVHPSNVHFSHSLCSLVPKIIHASQC
jgi:hypothetical protein